MYCAACGKPLTQLDSGAYLQCCNGVGYLYDQPPLDRDAWAMPKKYGKFWFYPSDKWFAKE